jgi:hypothetical protein
MQALLNLLADLLPALNAFRGLEVLGGALYMPVSRPQTNKLFTQQEGDPE